MIKTEPSAPWTVELKWLHEHLCVFFFNDTATTEIYTLSLHDALPICRACGCICPRSGWAGSAMRRDRKSTRLNSSHGYSSHAVFCLKNKSNFSLRLWQDQGAALCS